ncbi:early transcribed membrane protein 11.2 [Plasmodium reichenowi]|uniref:Early transcribed membrane protein 11.2 n=1 Tax=Plasmodium reichenowi TaxID=5854 RepID=A0A060RU78_PLARE|nr:early transcribed membrane protein 11.2 [Plasmodium reichenowi]SOV84153.1 early transcribed membrane protein 11.2 [Plasmodium reichenowi]
MKITKIFYFFAALLALNFIAPNYFNGYVEAKKALTPAEKKKRNQQIMLISGITSALALLIGAGVGLGIHYKNKNNGDEKKDKAAAKTTPAAPKN